MHDNIVHDFNNLLLVLQSRVEMLRADLGAEDPHRPQLDELLSTTERAQKLLARIHAPQRDATALRGNEVILVVEDDDDARRVVRDILELYGYTVFESADGAAALRMLEYLHPAPDVILTDLLLPERSGLEIIHELFMARKLPPVLLMSACDTIPPHQAADIEIPFIAKPFRFEELARRIREILDAAPTRPQSADLPRSMPLHA